MNHNKLSGAIETDNDMVVDLVCGMEFKKSDAKFQSEHQDKTYYFCSKACKKHFDDNPEKYAE